MGQHRGRPAIRERRRDMHANGARLLCDGARVSGSRRDLRPCRCRRSAHPIDTREGRRDLRPDGPEPQEIKYPEDQDWILAKSGLGKNENINILLCFLLSYSIGNAQSIKRSVICSFGSSNSNATTNISTTLGQPSNIGSVTDGLSYIRQGFQQPLGCVGGPISVITNPTICDGDSIVVGSSVYFLSGLS